MLATNRINRTKFELKWITRNMEGKCAVAESVGEYMVTGDCELEGSFVERTMVATRWARGQQQGHPRKSIFLCSFLAFQPELFRLKLVPTSFAGGWQHDSKWVMESRYFDRFVSVKRRSIPPSIPPLIENLKQELYWGIHVLRWRFFTDLVAHFFWEICFDHLLICVGYLWNMLHTRDSRLLTHYCYDCPVCVTTLSSLRFRNVLPNSLNALYHVEALILK